MFVHSLNEIFVVCFLLWLVTLKCIRMITFFCLVLTKASLMAGGEHGDMKKKNSCDMQIITSENYSIYTT